MARQCCRDSVAMKVIADENAETEGYVTPCRWCERHATYRGGRWIFSEDDPIEVRHATSAALLTHPDRVARITEVLGRPCVNCHTCGQPEVWTQGAAMRGARIPERGEVHHVHGRRGDLRFETRAALLLCLSCHEQVTGRVNERWIVLASKTFTTRQGEWTNASYPVSFERVA